MERENFSGLNPTHMVYLQNNLYVILNAIKGNTYTYSLKINMMCFQAILGTVVCSIRGTERKLSFLLHNNLT